jgi:hypothetical protein
VLQLEHTAAFSCWFRPGIFLNSLLGLGTEEEWGYRRVSTEVTFWHSAEYGSDFRLNSGEIPRNSAEFRGISPELSRNHFRSQKIPRNSVSAEFRGHPNRTVPPGWRNSFLGSIPEPVFVNVYGAQDSIPRNRFRQPM